MHLRLATLEDSKMIYNWRNAPEIRKFMFNTKEFSLSEHEDWYRDSLVCDSRIMLIGIEQDQAIGLVRFDICNTIAEVGIFLQPDKIGKGYGAALLVAGELWLRQNHCNIQQLIANVLPENSNSKRLFKKHGYLQKDNTFMKDISLLSSLVKQK